MVDQLTPVIQLQAACQILLNLTHLHYPSLWMTMHHANLEWKCHGPQPFCTTAWAEAVHLCLAVVLVLTCSYARQHCLDQALIV